MTSWRDSASQQSQDDLDGLLNSALPFAQQMLDKNGEFFPYGVALDAEGPIEMVAGWTGSERPPSAEVLQVIGDALRTRAATLRAVAIVADVLTDGSEAIRVELEHREGASMTVLLPYKKRRFGQGIEYGDLAAGATHRRIWSTD
ncbi:MAG TPA: hypothetical protein DEG43_03370 [Acidimicrobiaceae bacterium]|nr:hypothetical protein [Acidimicrobiaceae bacterium]